MEEDMTELYAKAKEAAKYVEQVPGAADVLVEQAMGLPQLLVKYDRSKIARYGIDIEELNSIIRTAYAGETAGVVFENERRFDLVLRLDNEKVKDLNIDKLFVRTGEGIQIPVSEVASIDLENGPLQIKPRCNQTTDCHWGQCARCRYSAGSRTDTYLSGEKYQVETGILLGIRRTV